MKITRVAAPLAIVGALALTLGACGSDDDDAGSATTAAPATTTADSTHDTMDHGSTPDDHPIVEVQGIDYGFHDLPEEVEAGTALSFTNVSDKEFHEMVVIRIPDEETRSVEELTMLPPEESDAIFAGSMPALVMVAAPGEDGMAVVGDGTLTEPGRYAVMCFIPIGADPAVVAEAMQASGDEAPDLGDGAPHFTGGMYGELTVTA
jgi:hypothetical protein